MTDGPALDAALSDAVARATAAIEADDAAFGDHLARLAEQLEARGITGITGVPAPLAELFAHVRKL
ncbi:MAG: hypothetical protein RL385_5026, partial [Pseudomonadota bacterium]